MKKVLAAALIVLVIFCATSFAGQYLSMYITSYCYVYKGTSEKQVYGYIQKGSNVIVNPVDEKWAQLIFGPVRHTTTNRMLEDKEVGKDAHILRNQLSNEIPDKN